MHRTQRALAAAVALALAAALVAIAPPQAKRVHAVGGSWPMYHLDGARSGYDTLDGIYSSQSTGGWSHSGLDGQVYGSPLVYSGYVYVATENNTVYALNETTGAEVWHTHLGPAVSSSRLGCGNVSPVVGVTSTMVIDTATATLFAVALVSTGSSTMQDEIFALRTGDGIGATGWAGESIDLGGAIDPRSQGQRAALAIANGYVYVPFGGRYGDCGTYHPQVVAVHESDGSLLSFQPQAGGQNRAGIWGPSGPAVDNAGNVYVSTGNGAETNCSNPYDWSEAVIKLSPTLALTSAWAPGNWCALNAGDTDIGSIGPSLLNNLGRIFQTGKAGDGYIVDQTFLGGIGGEVDSAHVDSCPHADAVFGGNAYDGSRVFVPCDNTGIIALYVGSRSFSVAWTSGSQGGTTFSAGAPIIAGGIVWSLDQNSSNMYGFDEASGALKFTINVGAHQHFQTPAAADGYVFVANNTGVTAVKFNTAPPAYTAYFTWYDHGGAFAVDDIHVVNPNVGSVLVNVTIPGHPGCFLGSTVAGGADQVFSCPTGYGGPVTIQATARVLASQRVLFNNSFNEIPAMPAGNAANTLYLTWYDLATPGFATANVHVINPGPNLANVSVVFPGCGPYSSNLAAGAQIYFYCQGGYGGPVTIYSSGNPVLASQRVVYYQTFNEVAAKRGSDAATSLFMPWFDTHNPGFEADNVHVINPGTVTASVTVNIPGCAAQARAIPAGQQTFVSCSNSIGGPVTVTSSSPVLAAQRVLYYLTFNESSAQSPANASNALWFTWYDSRTTGFVADNVHVVDPGPGPATVYVSIPGCGNQLAGTLAAGTEAIVSCPNGYGGPVYVTSSGNSVLASQRSEFFQSFNEILGQG